ncbi:type I-C CRISPR-associated protein Cas8c/Csd1 [Marispirochaeta aestuarii]|uniref:type I-C CRISPR-associated protein Cas8c/Csd1 n=1 Tax=Marispirochaeta aestuarii TaxID=1963862 RepID=UPI002ABD38D7|nr:type I-C CRISPR-associated protein Cas8c/Csd1 [Marispirochaeta aestuarii]
MILQALKEYYDRKASDPDSGMAPEGWITGGLDFLIEIDNQGNYVEIESLQEQQGKKTVSKSMLLPCIGKQALKHSNSGKDANLLWDNASFVLGLGDKGSLRLSSMIDAIDAWFAPQENVEVDAVRTFLSRGLDNSKSFSSLLNDETYGESLRSGQAKISFKIKDSTAPVVFETASVREKISKQSMNTEVQENEIRGTCLITGEQKVPIELTHSVIKGVWDAQSSGACIVGFNKDSFLSYGKKQSANAPVSKKSAAKYVKALNFLLDSTQRMQVGDASTVFWSARKTHFENDFPSFFKEPEKDNPAANTSCIKNLFNSVHTGSYFEDPGDTKFYVLGLAPNAARISVRFWQTGTVAEFASRIRQHFEDLRIVKSEREPEYYSLWRLLVNIATQDKSENIPPNLAGEFMRSILQGTPYPTSLLQAAIRRIKSDTANRVKPVRAALIKAYLNRYYRFHPNKNEKEIKMALDREQPSIGYQLGRLFSVLEKIQEEANPGLNATIRERYYSAACSSPVTVFPTLMRLKNHHLAKLENPSRKKNMERLIGEIVDRFNDFPPHLNLHEQGRFAIGYYHQRQDFFTKKEQ